MGGILACCMLHWIVWPVRDGEILASLGLRMCRVRITSRGLCFTGQLVFGLTHRAWRDCASYLTPASYYLDKCCRLRSLELMRFFDLPSATTDKRYGFRRGLILCE